MAPAALKAGSAAFFCGYVLLLIVAGAFGVVFARLGLRWLVGLDVGSVSHRAGATLGSQYRFLRAIELGFGLFAFLQPRQIHRERSYNRVFLAVMGFGILWRVIALAAEDRPRASCISSSRRRLRGSP